MLFKVDRNPIDNSTLFNIYELDLELEEVSIFLDVKNEEIDWIVFLFRFLFRRKTLL